VATVSDLDYAELRRQRRELRRRQVRRRRLTALGILAALAVIAIFGLTRLFTRSAGASVNLVPAGGAAPSTMFRTPLPEEIRGVHISGPLMSLPGKFTQYLALKKDGLNAVEIDLKDENGNVSFVNGAARAYFDPKQAVAQAHKAGIYVIGRVVSFEDPITAVAHSGMAVQKSNGSIWTTSGGLAWLNPYSHQAWRYDVDVAVAAAKAGFDEIQFDYTRFPSDGDLSIIRYPGAHPQPMKQTIAAYLRYAASRLHPLGVRVSADVFGLSATRDLGIGQFPSQIGNVVDTIYPMTYPSHYTPGEFNLPNPNAAPHATVADSLRDFRAQLDGERAAVVPWLQDFSLGRTYLPADVAAQIAAARQADAGGFMLWNANGVYTAKELRRGAPPPLPELPTPEL
jgi:hypothetical protein